MSSLLHGCYFFFLDSTVTLPSSKKILMLEIKCFTGVKMFCTWKSCQKVVEPNRIADADQQIVVKRSGDSKPSWKDINLRHETFRRKSLIDQKNVRLVKIKTVGTFLNAVKSKKLRDINENEREPTELEIVDQPTEESHNGPQDTGVQRWPQDTGVQRWPQDTGVQRRSSMEDVASRISFDSTPTDYRKFQKFKKLVRRATMGYVISQ
jgi:hypothetical protein